MPILSACVLVCLCVDRGRRSWEFGGPDPLKICRRGQIMYHVPRTVNERPIGRF